MTEAGSLPGLFGTFISSLFLVLQWPTVGLLLLGVLLGFWVGLLPGVGGVTALSLMLPFLYGLDPLTAFVLLLGMHAVIATTGDVTSTLFGVPGEGTSAAVVLDGYPLARQGKAGFALGVALGSSMLGALIGALALALAVPFVRPLVLSVGPAEHLMLGLVGLSFVVGLSGRSVTRGMLMAGAGLLLSTVGPDQATGRLRLTFNEPYLFEGLNLLPVTIGLFGVPAVVGLMAQRDALGSAVSNPDGLLEGLRETLRRWRLVLRTSLLGAWLGAIPGIGGSTAQWIAYGQARQLTREKELFGRGSVDGLIAASAVNNAKEGGALLPTLAFGVPGSAAMVVLLGAFLITGLTPGPRMLAADLHVTFGLVWVIVLGNLLTVGLCLLLVRQLVWLAYLRARLLAPFVLLLLSIGAYSANGSWLDLVTLMAFGAVGLAAARWGWPAPPLLLGFVLGDVIERNYFLAASLFGSAWLTRPSVVGLIVLAVGVLLWPFLTRRAVARTVGVEAGAR